MADTPDPAQEAPEPGPETNRPTDASTNAPGFRNMNQRESVQERDVDGAERKHSSDEDLGVAAGALFAAMHGQAPKPINWRTLAPEEAEDEWLKLNEWVNWLRIEFGLAASVIPPLWHRHPELVWELSALHLRWLGAYDPAQNAAGPLAWMTDFHAAQHRLRAWVSTSGTRLDRDRPTRITTWPGEGPAPNVDEKPIADRDQDFVDFVVKDVEFRERAEVARLRDVTDA